MCGCRHKGNCELPCFMAPVETFALQGNNMMKLRSRRYEGFSIFLRELLNLANTRVARGTAVGIYGQLSTLLLQLASVPILAHLWGVQGFGAWLLLFTLPSALAIGDLGLIVAGTNEMTAAAALGNTGLAARIYCVLWRVALAFGVVIASILSFVFLVAWPDALAFAHNVSNGQEKLVFALLLVYGIAALLNQAIASVYRAVDAFALGGIFFVTVCLLEGIVALSAAWMGTGPLGVAFAYAAVRSVGTIAQVIFILRIATWLKGGHSRFDVSVARMLLRPGLAALVYSVANAVTLQGSVLVIGVFGGTASVPAFTTVRTLSRTALQFVARLSVASMHRYTTHNAVGNEAEKTRLMIVNLLLPLLILAPWAILLMIFGQSFVMAWTGSKIQPSLTLTGLLALAMLFSGGWNPLSNLILAVNRHAAFTWFYFAASCVTVAAGAIGVTHFGATGMGAALAIQEFTMVIWVWRLAARDGMLSRTGLMQAAGELRRRFGNDGAK